jgi:galactose oxidase-like protein
MNQLRKVYLFIAVAVLLAVFGVPGAGRSVALAGLSPVPNWTQQSPAASPAGLYGWTMVYDAATGNVVLFGGVGVHHNLLGQTWIWNGSDWIKQSPVHHPVAIDVSMAYDAATGNVVLFGGLGTGGASLNGTWVWNGSDWIKRSPAVSPPPRWDASMDYDAATGNVVLSGGAFEGVILGDTWIWDGSDWIEQSPVTSPPARYYASMAYDAATGNVVLFGGIHSPNNTFVRDDTWVWDGSNWTEQDPATHPPARASAAMAYDAATGNVVLFGGYNRFHGLKDTWVWASG